MALISWIRHSAGSEEQLRQGHGAAERKGPRLIHPSLDISLAGVRNDDQITAAEGQEHGRRRGPKERSVLAPADDVGGEVG